VPTASKPRRPARPAICVNSPAGGGQDPSVEKIVKVSMVRGNLIVRECGTRQKVAEAASAVGLA